MSQNQKPFSAQIYDQLNHVMSLANDLKKHVLLASVSISYMQNKKRLDLQFLRLFQIMESHLQNVICLDDDELTDNFEFQHRQDLNFNKKTLAQIIGLSQFDESYEQTEDLPYSQHNLIKLQNRSISNIASVRGPYRSYKIQDKLKVVNLYKEGRSYAFISRYLQIPQKNIVRWCKNGVIRKQGAGRKIGDAEMQKSILRWISQNFSEGSQIKSKEIRQKAIQFSTKNEFKSSKGWLKNFIRRHHLNKKFDIV